MDATEIPFDADLIARLEEALQGFSVEVGRLAEVRSPVRGTRNRFTAGPEKASTNLSERYSDYWAARKELLFLTYSEVLELLGPPQGVDVTQGGAVRWTHKHPNYVTFIDGIVMQIWLEG